MKKFDDDEYWNDKKYDIMLSSIIFTLIGILMVFLGIAIYVAF
jgi:hypothetical protein